jgi:hypothetical protein
VVQLHGRSEERDGEKFMATERLGIDFHLGGKSRFRIRDVVNGNTVIGKLFEAYNVVVAANNIMHSGVRNASKNVASNQ